MKEKEKNELYEVREGSPVKEVAKYVFEGSTTGTQGNGNHASLEFDWTVLRLARISSEARCEL